MEAEYLGGRYQLEERRRADRHRQDARSRSDGDCGKTNVNLDGSEIVAEASLDAKSSFYEEYKGRLQDAPPSKFVPYRGQISRQKQSERFQAISELKTKCGFKLGLPA